MSENIKQIYCAATGTLRPRVAAAYKTAKKYAGKACNCAIKSAKKYIPIAAKQTATTTNKIIQYAKMATKRSVKAIGNYSIKTWHFIVKYTKIYIPIVIEFIIANAKKVIWFTKTTTFKIIDVIRKYAPIIWKHIVAVTKKVAQYIKTPSLKFANIAKSAAIKGSVTVKEDVSTYGPAVVNFATTTAKNFFAQAKSIITKTNGQIKFISIKHNNLVPKNAYSLKNIPPKIGTAIAQIAKNAAKHCIEHPKRILTVLLWVVLPQACLYELFAYISDLIKNGITEETKLFCDMLASFILMVGMPATFFGSLLIYVLYLRPHIIEEEEDDDEDYY